MKINYQLICDSQIEELTCNGKVPKLLLHSCCGPCSTYVLEYLANFFDVTVLFYNPNIFPQKEFEKRFVAQEEVIKKLKTKHSVSLVCKEYNHSEFTDKTVGFESSREGGARCDICFRLRLSEAARYAKENGYDCFTTTLSVSPHKNAESINLIGEELSGFYGVTYLTADFKKKNGYKRSVELSRIFQIYRQDYCGCEYSICTEEKKL